MRPCRNSSSICARITAMHATTMHRYFHRSMGEIPDGVDQMFYDLQPLFETATDAWVSWDDKL